MRDGAAQVEVEHAGLDPGDTLVGVDVEDAVEPRRHDDERVPDRRRAAGETGATPPRHEGAVVARRDPHRGRDLAAVTREADGGGAAGGNAGVAGVQRELERFCTRTVVAEFGAQVGEQRVGVDRSRL